MRIVNAELLLPSVEEIKKIVQMAYDKGRLRGREEAKHELQGLVASPGDGDRDANKAGHVRPDRDTTVYRMFTGGKC